MSIKDCLVSAADQGVITRQEAEDLAAQFDEHLNASRANMGEALALAEAKKALEQKLRNNAGNLKRRADLTEAARLRLKARFMKEKDFYSGAENLLSHYGYANGSSVRGLSEAIITDSQRQVSEVMFAFQRTAITGKRNNRAMMADWVDAMHGAHTGDSTANTLGKAVTDLFEDLRLRFNAAGGDMPKLEGFGLPHRYDARAVRELGPDGFKKLMLENINASAMRDSLTDAPITPARLDLALRHSYDQIVSDSAAHMTPTTAKMGLGAISGRRQEQRFFVFRDGKSWLNVNKQIGEGDALQAVFHHMNSMSKDIAAMELLGPNPDAMVEWMKQVVLREFGQKQAGYANRAGKVLLTLNQDEGRSAAARIGWLWQSMRGNGVVNSGWVKFNNNVKDFTSSAILGTTGWLAGLTDPFTARAARNLANMPASKNMAGMLDMLSKQNRDDIIRSGVIWDEYHSVMADEVRFFGQMEGNGLIKYIADRAMMANGLKPLTTGRKLVEARAWQASIGELARNKVTFQKLDPQFRHTLEGFGIDENHWKIWSGSVDHLGLVTPGSIREAGGSVSYIDMGNPIWSDAVRGDETRALAHREAADKLAELTSSWSERSVPAGAVNERSLLTAGRQRGTIPGELLSYFSQLKGFPLSYTARQAEALVELTKFGPTKAMSYFAKLTIGLTMGAAAYVQIKHLLNGEDMEPMDNLGFWGKAIFTGGGFGVFGDFVKQSENRFGQSLTEAIAGPGLAVISDSVQLAWQLLADGIGVVRQDENGFKSTVNETRQFAQRWTPVASSNFALKTAYNRIILDNLQYMTDPKAQKRFKQKYDKAKKNGSPFWLPPGTFTPAGPSLPQSRAPDFGSALQ